MNNKKYTLAIVIAIGFLMCAAFYVGKHNQQKTVVVPPFPTYEHDSLGVYRVVGTDHYLSKDKSLKIDISYIQLGEGSFYQLRFFYGPVPNEKDGGLSMVLNGMDYYGLIYYTDDGTQEGYFISDLGGISTIAYHNGDKEKYIMINDKKMPIERAS